MAVLWIDMVQTLLLAAAGVLAVCLVCGQLPGGLGTVLEVGWRDGKFALPPVHLGGAVVEDFVQLTLVVLVLHGIFNQLLYYSADQTVIQRYLAPGSSREARKALWIGSLGVVPIFVFFTFLGTALYVFYAVVPDPAIPGLSADEVFPHFILTQVPRGLVGLIVAALLAAALSSLDSSLNAIALVFQVDVYRRHLAPGRSDAHYLRVARLGSLGAGAIVTCGALALTEVPARTVLDLMFLLYAVFAGGLAGLFLLGMLTRRTTAPGIGVGIAVSLAVGVYLTCSHAGWLIPPAHRAGLHPYLINAAGNLSLVLVAYGASRLFSMGNAARPKIPADKLPEAGRDLRGLTVWDA